MTEMTFQVEGHGTLAIAIRHHLKVCPAHFLWCAWDTPILANGRPDNDFVLLHLKRRLDERPPSLVVITSQLPVGTCAALEMEFRQHRFVAYPENVRALHATEDFGHQPRIVLGARRPEDAVEVSEVLRPFTERFIITTPETAEMVKHGLNGFLAASITYAHELAAIAGRHGADPNILAECLLSDPRIGARAYLKPAGDLGAHLGREVHNLVALGGGPLIRAMAQANGLNP